MFSLIYIVVIDICAFFFIGYGIYCFSSKKAIPFLFAQSKNELKVSNSNIKQFNRAVSFLHIFFGLCLLIVGIIATYLNLRIASFVLLLVLFACVPTLSYAYNFLLNRYKV